MHVHMPKAFHGWREFAKEVGIIVLGVLIALAGEQLVEGYHQREAAATASEAIDSELLHAWDGAETRIAVDTCVRDRIAHLSSKLASSGDQWIGDPMPFAKVVPDMPVLPMAYSVPSSIYPTDAWTMAVANGLPRFMLREKAEGYAEVYQNIVNLKAYYQEESSLAAKLQPLSQSRKIDTRISFETASTLGSLDHLNSIITLSNKLLVSQIEDLHIDTRPAQKGVQDFLRTYRQFRDACVGQASFVNS